MSLFSFPNPVNEYAPRVVAVCVVTITTVMLATGWWWISAVLAYGFIARTASGPRFSPLGLFATKVVVPRLGLEPKWTPGPPKRFAQAIGAVVTTSIAISALTVGNTEVATALSVLILLAASLEGFVGYCIGCKIFGLLMRIGLIPQSVCEACNDLTLRASN